MVRKCIPALLSILLAAPALAQDYTGWWWNPEEPGTGYSLEVQDVPGKDYDLAYLVWYLYDQSGVNIWYSSIMQVRGRKMTGALIQYTKRELDTGIMAIEPVEVGQVALRIAPDYDNLGFLYFTVQGRNVSKYITRWEQAGTQDSGGLTGWWWDEDKPGMGWFIEARNNRCFLGWFNYRDTIPCPGCNPRWFIALDENFDETRTEFSQPLLEYSGGQTYTSEYKEPSFEVSNPTENFEFTIPADATPESLDLTYEGNAYHLTRFAIPDIFTFNIADCAPEPVSLAPAPGECVYSIAKPIIRALVNSRCGSAIDNASIAMTLDGIVVPHYDNNADPEIADIRYKPENYLSLWYIHQVNVTVADEEGRSTTLDWRFFIEQEYY